MLSFTLPALAHSTRFDRDSDFESDTASESTLEDCHEGSDLFGAPLTRMVNVEYLSSPSDQSSDDEDLEDMSQYFIRDEEINYIDEDVSLFRLALNAGGDGEGPDGDPLLRTTNQTYVNRVIDHFAVHAESSSLPRLTLHATPSYPSYPLLVRHLPSTSIAASARELAIWRYLNEFSLRRDPWNPSPPALSIVERELSSSTADRLAHIVEFGMEAEGREDEAFIVMDKLYPIKDNPLRDDNDWIDFIRQMLQGLVFLHEHNITQALYYFPDESNPQSIMMDIGLAPPRTHFSRVDFPVKYYLLDFAKAIRLQVDVPRRFPRFTASRGRTMNAIQLTASRSRVSSKPPESFISSLAVDTPASNLPVRVACARHPDSAELLSPKFNDNTSSSIVELETSKQSHFFSPTPGHPSESEPAPNLESDESTSDEDEEETATVRVVSAATRNLFFASDLKQLAGSFQGIIPTASPLSEALIPMFSEMQRATALSLTAANVLEMFEDIVRDLHQTSPVSGG